jgi:sugar lactone lactonase YvrE
VPKPSIRPHTWQPPAAPSPPGHGPDPRVAAIEHIPVPGRGPEDIAFDGDGNGYTGLEDGRILRLPGDGGRPVQVAWTGGRPLGIEVYPSGEAVLVADAYEGLLVLDLASGDLAPLATRDHGVHLANNAAIASDGTIYFTDSTTRFTLEHYEADILEHSRTGRLLARRPDGDVEVLLDGLAFANGVALAADERSVLVAESGGYAIRRVWVAGDRAGTSEMFADNLEGFPDNLSSGSDGTIWCAIASPRNPALDLMLPRNPLLRRLAWKLPDAVRPAAGKATLVLGFGPDGEVRHRIDGGGAYTFVTGVREHDGWLYLTSIHQDGIARLPLG